MGKCDIKFNFAVESTIYLRQRIPRVLIDKHFHFAGLFHDHGDGLARAEDEKVVEVHLRHPHDLLLQLRVPVLHLLNDVPHGDVLEQAAVLEVHH